jgi:hypothetical protein
MECRSMARKLAKPGVPRSLQRDLGFVTITEFSRRIGVSQPAVSQAVSGGRLRAYDGRGKRVSPDYAGRKWLRTLEAAEDWDNSRLRLDDWFLER